MMRPATRIASLGLAALLAGLLGACSGDDTTPEEEIRAWIDMMQEYAENKERRDIIDYISPAYADARGHSRDDVENILRLYFLRQNAIALISTIDEIKVIGGSAAEVSLTVAGAGTRNSGLGLDADVWNFELELEHDGDDWRLISARWGELGQQLR